MIFKGALVLVAMLCIVVVAADTTTNVPELEMISSAQKNATDATEITTKSSTVLSTQSTPFKIVSTTFSPEHHEMSSTEKIRNLMGGELYGDYTDDWDYMESRASASPRLATLMRYEWQRHKEFSESRSPSRLTRIQLAQAVIRTQHRHGLHLHGTPTPPPFSWNDFCKEAALDDDEESPRLSDGSFHPQYEEVPGVGVYRLHATPRSWADARRVCEGEGAQLALPNSREEALALVEIHNRCPRLLPTHFNDYQFLGAHDEYGEGQWETVVGYPLNETGYVAWAYNQPDNAHHFGENCLTMNRRGFYNDVPCWTELPFICEHA